MGRRKKLTPLETRDVRRRLHLAVDAGGLTVTETIRRMRLALGMTQAEFGKAFDLSERQVWQLENSAANPTAQTLERLGKPFGFVPGFISRARKEAKDISGEVLFVEARPKGRPEGTAISDYVVEREDGTVIFVAPTQREAIDWAKRQGATTHIARVRHLNNRRAPDHWRAV